MLTELACKNAKPGTKPKKIFDAFGLYLQIQPNGSKYWMLKYRFQLKEKRISLGVYPLISLSVARQKREEARLQLSHGSDPSECRRKAKLAERYSSEQTFEFVAREWIASNTKKWGQKHADDIGSRLELHVFPSIGRHPVNTITTPQLVDCVRNIEKRELVEVPRRALGDIERVLRYSVQTGRIAINPALNLKGLVSRGPVESFASIDHDELPEFLDCLESNRARLFRQTALAVKLIALTFVRTKELIGATWDEINFDDREWVVAARRMKMRREHIVPLSHQSITLLKELKMLSKGSRFVFPHRTNALKHMSSNTILSGLDEMGYKGQMTGHGFRSLAMTIIKEKLGYRHDVIDRQLAHAKNAVDKAYDRAEFLGQRKVMMQDWADYLEKLRLDFLSSKTEKTEIIPVQGRWEMASHSYKFQVHI